MPQRIELFLLFYLIYIDIHVCVCKNACYIFSRFSLFNFSRSTLGYYLIHFYLRFTLSRFNCSRFNHSRLSLLRFIVRCWIVEGLVFRGSVGESNLGRNIFSALSLCQRILILCDRVP